MSSCAESFLDQENTTNIGLDNFFDNDDAVDQAIYPLYNFVWSSFNDKLYYSMGDGRSNNITAQWSNYIKVYTNLNETSLAEGLADGWNALYSVVAQSNNVINAIKERSTAGVSEAAKTRGIAEARFMRGVANWYLASLWGNSILYENTSAMVGNYVVPTNPRTDVMEYAIRDLEYAAKYLPVTSPAAGRVNKYTAYGMLSRVYLSMAGLTTEGEYNGSNVATDFNRGTRNPYYLDLAKKAALKVINESSYKLMDNYGDLFEIDNNNCQEDMFQLQWIVGSTDAVGWGCNQGITAFFGWSTMVAEGTNWGGATCCSWDLFCEFNGIDVTTGQARWEPETSQSSRRHYCVASYGDYYPNLYKSGGGYTYGVTESASTNGANIKKYVVGTTKDDSRVYKQSSAINTHMLRLAEVYLNLAEAIMGNDASTTDATALLYFNKVRERAGVPAVKSLDYETLRHERRLEFAFEGRYWYDLVNRAYYRQSEVVNYMNNQDRNRTYKYDSAEGAYVKSENPGAGVATATSASMLLPYPDSDQNINGYLKNVGAETKPYEFGEREVTVSDLF